ncbi:hypothetical protein HK105_208074 [Polyrhizophydium stewartii]|uniref:Uncharacterized protein n=1 Tax=Polyrhizophydium stewartii TaxID=2732419 RepID=A0ABR4MYW4_9FUNG
MATPYGSVPMTVAERADVADRELCVAYCSGPCKPSCQRLHRCFVCFAKARHNVKFAHPKSAQVCLHWNRGRTGDCMVDDCIRRHVCARCLSPDHTVMFCPVPPPARAE